MWEGPKEPAPPANGRPKRNAAAYADYAVDSGDMESDDGDGKLGGHHATRGTGKTKRNAKQQVQNKQAQQRCPPASRAMPGCTAAMFPAGTLRLKFGGVWSTLSTGP